MVAIDPQYFDIQPQQDNNNILFNDLVNVVPVAHPRTGMWYRERIEVKDWDKQRHWFRKRKWFKKVDLYRWVCWDAPEKENLTEERLDWEFTDETIYEWHRWFIRLNKTRDKAKVYVQWFINPEECTNWVYAPISAWAIIDVTWSFDIAKQDYPSRNWYYLDFAPCWFDRFLPTRWLKYENLQSVQTPNPTWDWRVMALYTWSSYEWVLYDKEWNYSITQDTPYIRLNDTGMVVEYWWQVCPDIAAEHKLPLNAIFVTWSLWSNYQYFENLPRCSAVREIADTVIENKIAWWITLGNKMWSTISLFTVDWITWISAYWQREWDEDDFNRCFYISSFAIPWTSTKEKWNIITWATIYNNRIAFVRDNNTLVIWWWWNNQSWFPAWNLSSDNADHLIWIHTLPSWITDCIAVWNAIVLLWPHTTQYFIPDWNNWRWWVYEITDRSWYFNKWSWCYKDWKIFVARTYKDLYYLEYQVSSYAWISFNYSYYSQYINSHLRSLHRVHDKINIDMTDNNTYVCIQDNDYDEKYSKVLIQDRQYNFWYTWVINWARISRIKDEVYFWDNIYSYEWDTDNWKEIIEIISATWWDETIQATKHFINVKMAVWENSNVWNKTTLETNVTDSWLEQIERIDITPVRYPNLLWKKEAWVVHRYDIWLEISTLWKKDSHSLQNEILRYKSLDTSLIKRDEEAERLWTYAPIVYKVNRDWELIKLTAVARWIDDLEFWWFFIWYYQQDYDFWDIAESMVTPSELTYASEHIWHKMPAVEDPITLGHI